MSTTDTKDSRDELRKDILNWLKSTNSNLTRQDVINLFDAIKSCAFEHQYSDKWEYRSRFRRKKAFYCDYMKHLKKADRSYFYMSIADQFHWRHYLIVKDFVHRFEAIKTNEQLNL